MRTNPHNSEFTTVASPYKDNLIQNKKKYFKITFQDIEIAENFFENDKYLDEFLLAVCKYYRGKKVEIKTKIVKKYFETYKKVMDSIIIARENGMKGFIQKSKNQSVINNTLEPSLSPFLSTNISKKKEIDKENIKPLTFSFSDSLVSYGAEKELVIEWLLVRENKNSTNTETALNRFISEVEKNGNDINFILKECISKSWASFESDWIIKENESINWNALINEFNQKFPTSKIKDIPKITKTRFAEAIKCVDKKDIILAMNNIQKDPKLKYTVSIDFFSNVSNIQMYKNYKHKMDRL